MSISIKLPPELEEKLLESASEAGMDVNQYVLEILEGQLQPGASKGGGKQKEKASCWKRSPWAFRLPRGKGITI